MVSILRTSPKPLSAYMISRESRALGAPLAPNQVYRILARLRGRVRRVEMLNAYFVASDDAGALTSCQNCGRTVTLDVDIGDEVARLCAATGFLPLRLIVEVPGECANCASKSAGRTGRSQA